MGLSLRSVGRFIGKGIDALTPNISVGGHRFSPLGPAGGVRTLSTGAGAALGGRDVGGALSDELMAQGRTGAAGLALGAGGGGAALGAGGGGAAGAAGAGGGWGGALQAVGKYAPLALGAWSAYEGHKGDQRAQELQDRALAMAERRYAEMGPLREQAMQRMLNAQRPDLSALTYDAGNPYSRSRRIPPVGSGA